MIVIRLLTWLIHRLGVSTSLSLLLLFIALGSVLRGLAIVSRSYDPSLMLLVVFLGVLLGWLLAKSVLPEWLAGLIALAVGSEALLIQVGQLSQPGLALAQVAVDLSASLWRWPLTGPPELAPAAIALSQLVTRLNTLLLRLSIWGWALATGQPAFDPVAATLVWGLILWVTATWAGWMVRRRAQPLLALTPAGAVLVTILAHTRVPPTPLAPFLGATLLLLPLVGHHARERNWQAAGISFSLVLRSDLAIAVVPLSLALVMFAALVPLIPIRQITQFTQRLIWGETPPQGELAAGALGLESKSDRPAFDPIRVGGLPRRHLLGSGPELSEQVVLVIQTDDPPPAAPDERAARYYWRSLTYDFYAGRGWLTGPTRTAEIIAGEPITADSNLRQRILRQDVQVTTNLGSLLFAAGEPVTVNQDLSVAWRSEGDIFGATVETATYRVESRLPDVTVAQIRAAGSDYPDWIVERYLRLPNSVPNRVLTLARDITARAPTPYDRAKALESYLRTFPYTLDLPAPPRNRDIVDYFLFDLQQGYCDYYATSMVVMARAAGLPARLAIGYINGTYDAGSHRYVVSEAEAHSWVEIYFPEIGWVNFEPTGGRPAIERGDEPVPANSPELGTTPPLTAPWPGDRSRQFISWLAFPITLTLLLLAAVAWWGLDLWRLRRLNPAIAVASLHERLYGHARRLNTPLVVGDTPYEFALTLGEHVKILTMRKYWREFLAPAPLEIRRLTSLYVRARYSPHQLAVADRAQAIQLWQRLRRRLWLAWVIRRPR